MPLFDRLLNSRAVPPCAASYEVVQWAGAIGLQARFECQAWRGHYGPHHAWLTVGGGQCEIAATWEDTP